MYGEGKRQRGGGWVGEAGGTEVGGEYYTKVGSKGVVMGRGRGKTKVGNEDKVKWVRER